jgi:hypothetical protein
MASSRYMTQQRGAVLVTSLIFLVVLTVIALVANQSSVLEVRMSSNSIAKGRATESSETLRTASNELIDAHLFYRGWPTSVGGNLGYTDQFYFSTGVDLANTNDWGAQNSTGEDLFTPSTWVKDMSLRIDGNSDGDYTDDVDQDADLYVYKTVVVNSTGSATAMVAGYEGLGKSSASGGALIFFDLRSVGTSAGNASSTTGSNYRYVVRN